MVLVQNIYCEKINKALQLKRSLTIVNKIDFQKP
jgi:hypothetical protein